VKLFNTLFSATFHAHGPLVASILALLPLLCTSTPAQAETQVRFTYSADGAEVTDARTGLTWQRCSLGQLWKDGTCTGTASSHPEKQAAALAKAKSGWRMPTVKELSSLIDTRRGSPTIDASAFPATPSAWFCTASPYLGSASLAWYVSFQHGESSPLNREQRHLIRLVRK